jgi:hypothetical protein
MNTMTGTVAERIASREASGGLMSNEMMRRMIETHPVPPRKDLERLVAAIEACAECAQICTICADACLHEDDLSELVDCVMLNLDCADICTTTGRVLSRLSAPDWTMIRLQLQSCIAACEACGNECAKHAEHHEHCRICAASCHECEQFCNSLLQSL